MSDSIWERECPECRLRRPVGPRERSKAHIETQIQCQIGKEVVQAGDIKRLQMTKKTKYSTHPSHQVITKFYHSSQMSDHRHGCTTTPPPSSAPKLTHISSHIPENYQSNPTSQSSSHPPLPAQAQKSSHVHSPRHRPPAQPTCILSIP